MGRATIAVMVAISLAGCSDPLKKVPNLQQVELSEGAGQADIVAPEEEAPAAALRAEEAPKSGLFGFLKRKADEAEAAPAQDVTTLAEAALAEADEAPEETAANETVLDTPKRGLFSKILHGGAPKPKAAPEPQPEVQLAAMAPPEPQTAPKPKQKSGGLFSRILNSGDTDRAGGTSAPKAAKTAKGPKPGAPDYQQVALGDRLPYGALARVCDAPRGKLGRKIGGYPERGSQYTLYDSAPGSTAPHNFYLTGFDDNCARVFTAALVMFGSPESYEQINYGPAGNTQPKSDTDRAYEQVKSRVCKVGKGKPCGSAMSRLARDTVFVSVYERFDSNPRWKNMLLHDGEVVAVDMKQ
ncbi:hypothetical protein [Tropicibacter naphthalenivorans]|uniref:Uncharacterized protein n=1 Tax=Tropicibacter naphthalenivorans TaxID=441103 RepID=A0A0P1GR10_9RHOB|nr:hypothetical protein [Tropicibacter naphthalenivorans]CUH78152.1 hypothetical protein TRN7648_01823 [Tropicibacter naphthalenivorans]SMC93339.1 hypothetical protein SAMN04488093_10717 [Tropicibacter naphthalenivorans]